MYPERLRGIVADEYTYIHHGVEVTNLDLGWVYGVVNLMLRHTSFIHSISEHCIPSFGYVECCLTVQETTSFLVFS